MKFSKSKTQQSFKRECNINYIVERARTAGGLPPNNRVPQYLDVSKLADYQSAQNTIIQAREAFEALPAKIRLRFKNDPQNMVEFMTHPENAQEAVELGIARISENEVKAETSEPEKRTSSKKQGEKKSIDLSNVQDLPLDE